MTEETTKTRPTFRRASEAPKVRRHVSHEHVVLSGGVSFDLIQYAYGHEGETYWEYSINHGEHRSGDFDTVDLALEAAQRNLRSRGLLRRED